MPLLRVSKPKLALAALNNVQGAELSLKNSLANGDVPLKNMCQNCKQKVRQHKQQGTWQCNRKAEGEGKNLISEKETEGTVNKDIFSKM